MAAVAVELRLLLLLFRLAEDIFLLEGLETRETDVGVLVDDEAEPFFTAQRANLFEASWEKPESSLTGHRWSKWTAIRLDQWIVRDRKETTASGEVRSNSLLIMPLFFGWLTTRWKIKERRKKTLDLCLNKVCKMSHQVSSPIKLHLPKSSEKKNTSSWLWCVTKNVIYVKRGHVGACVQNNSIFSCEKICPSLFTDSNWTSL